MTTIVKMINNTVMLNSMMSDSESDSDSKAIQQGGQTLHKLIIKKNYEIFKSKQGNVSKSKMLIELEILAQNLNINMGEFLKWQNQQNPEDVISLEELEMMGMELQCIQDQYSVLILRHMSKFLHEKQKLDKEMVKTLILKELIKLGWPVHLCCGYYIGIDMDDYLGNKVEFLLSTRISYNIL